MTNLEIFANVTTAICIFLAGRNSIHTWWTGLVACVAFGFLFFEAKLYADVLLQAFFFATGIVGWMAWSSKSKESQIKSASKVLMLKMLGSGFAVGTCYAALLYYFTDAYAPFIDSMVLQLSVIGQLLLMKRYKETWPVWIVVNVLSVPLYLSRELYLTAGLYSLFLVNAVISMKHFNRLYAEQLTPVD